LVQRFTSRTALKELRRLPYHHPELALDRAEIERSIVDLTMAIIITPSARRDEFERYDLGDRSDRPLVAEARHVQAVLVTADHRLAIDARAYVETLFITD
jgi:hypothetical protein